MEVCWNFLNLAMKTSLNKFWVLVRFLGTGWDWIIFSAPFLCNSVEDWHGVVIRRAIKECRFIQQIENSSKVVYPAKCSSVSFIQFYLPLSKSYASVISPQFLHSISNYLWEKNHNWILRFIDILMRDILPETQNNFFFLV